AGDRCQAFGESFSLLFLQPREVRLLSLARALHGRRIFRLIVCSLDHAAIGRGEHLRAVSVIIFELCAVAAMGQPIAAEFCDVERELFWSPPAMTGVKRRPPTREPNAPSRSGVFMFCECGLD